MTTGSPNATRRGTASDPAPFRQPIAAVSPTEELVLALLVEMRGLRQDLARDGRPAPTVSRADRAVLGRLFPPVGGVFGSDEFLIRELFEKDSAALRLVLNGLTSIRIGRLFQRAEGQVIDGYLVERTGGRELNTALWRVVEVAGSPLPAVPPHTARGLVE
jgi:hypothetical protein